MGKLFGTDGVRGVANAELTAELALALGRVGAFVLTKESKNNAPRVLVGKDPRRSGDMLEAALTAGLCSLGARVYRAGVVPTPAVAYLTRRYGMDAGVMISASHNPMRDNGIKFFSAQGFKLPDALEDEIESLLAHPEVLPVPEGADVGTVQDCARAEADYTAFLLDTVPGLSLAGTAVLLDCANGAVSAIAPGLFKRLGAAVRVVHHMPDGVNINARCGSTHIESLAEQWRLSGEGAGFAFDGDGDRVLCVDETGAVVDGDEILAVCGLDMHKRGLLPHNALVGTVMSNLGLSLCCRASGVTLYQTAVGDRYVLEKMLSEGYALGGEQSGHIIFRGHQTTGDGLLTALQLLSVMRREGKPLAALKRVMEKLPQTIRNAAVPNAVKANICANDRVAAAIAKAEARLGADGRVLVRASGTEPLVRVMIEGRDLAEINAIADALASTVEMEAACYQ